EFKALGKIASGGELSRLMLAVRHVISTQGGIGVYLFDEIDAGIGGQTAFQVGKKIKSVAKHNQVLCITHLPQVASFADKHWVVSKATTGKRTLAAVTELTAPQRKEELARMLGGEVLTKKSLENAAELMAMARQ
ncbi:DNA repair protein RecN, partial [Bdellovibrionota bacterium FG-2]